MKAATHRLQQGVRALLASTASLDLDLARQHLSDCEFNAFTTMSRAEQWHSLNVLGSVLEADPAAPPSVITAALLHDVGKARYHLAVWQKTLSVLVNAIAPNISQRLSRDESVSSWRAPFTVRRRHPKWGGEILQQCGSDETVIWLAAHHQMDPERFLDHPCYSLLKQLQRADAAN